MRLMSTPWLEPALPNEPYATRFPSINTNVSLGNRPRRLACTVPSPPLPILRFTVPPASCGRKVCKSWALRMPSFSMSVGRYVSTGFGPVSSAVGIFEPVTMTRSTSAAPGAAACWANAFAVKIKKNPTIAVREASELSGAFMSDAKGSTNPIRNISAETCNLISDMSPEATSEEVSFGCIRDIRGIRGVFQKFPKFPRKGSKNFTQYSYERPEITPHDEESTKAKTRKEKLNHE